MMRLLLSSCKFSIRRQNFFEMNPIYPDNGQKDFDIYNIHKRTVPIAEITMNEQTREDKIVDHVTKKFYLNAFDYRNWKDFEKGLGVFDQQTGFPLGINEEFDEFIALYKRQKKVGSNINLEFENLLMSLIQRFEVKSEIELIKIFRINLANLKKNNMKDKIRGLLINQAFIKYIKQSKKLRQPITYSGIEPFLKQQKLQKTKRQKQNTNKDIKEEELQEIVFQQSLKELDERIKDAEFKLRQRAIKQGVYIPSEHPEYGPRIIQEGKINLKYDINFKLGYSATLQTNQKSYSQSQQQDRFISSRINKLYFLRILNGLQEDELPKPIRQIIKQQQFPMHIRRNDKIINELIYKYKQFDLLVEPDLEDIYKEIDIALKRINVKLVPDYLKNQQQNALSKSDQPVADHVKFSDNLLWKNLDLQEVFESHHYEERQIENTKIQEKEIAKLSPSAAVELSLNKVPFNLYRHIDCQALGVFTKYKDRIYRDYIKDQVIDPETSFKFFSLEEAKTKLKKKIRVQETPDRVRGYAKRKSGQAEVYITPGTGKVTINNEPLEDYFGDAYHRGEALKPIIYTETAGKYDIECHVVGGGIHGQSECISMALCKAFVTLNPRYEKVLAGTGLLGTDDRRKESKKMGHYTARVRPPYVRR